MRKTLLGYYRPTEDEFLELWKQCLFVFDTNVLLNLYCYSQETREELLGILKVVSDRLWIPHQVALEYHRNRPDVIHQQASAYDVIQELLRSTKEGFEIELNTKLRRGRHPFIDVDSLLEQLSSVFTEVSEGLNKPKQEHPDLFGDDPIRDAITDLFEGKVGPSYPPERLKEIYVEGEKRYHHVPPIPPGYKDASNEEGNTKQYGDLVLWFQVIDQAKETEKPIILVTDDRKEDWWWRPKGKTFGPQPKLIEEMFSEAGVRFYMYSADPFMEYATRYLELEVKQEAIDEVRDVRIYDERYFDLQKAVVDLGHLTTTPQFDALQGPVTTPQLRILQELEQSKNAIQDFLEGPRAVASSIQDFLEGPRIAASSIMEFAEQLRRANSSIERLAEQSRRDFNTIQRFVEQSRRDFNTIQRFVEQSRTYSKIQSLEQGKVAEKDQSDKTFESDVDSPSLDEIDD